MKPYTERSKEDSCDGRERLTRATAQATARRATWPAEAYACRFCNCWHIGTKPKKPPALIRANGAPRPNGKRGWRPR